MPAKYETHVSTRATPQRESIPGRTEMVPNSEGGYVWPVNDVARLDRFLILGSEAGSYYASEQKLTRENADAVIRLIQGDGDYVVDRTVEISQSGRAAKNDPALFVLALCAGLGDANTRARAMMVLPQVARIGTHLFTFLNYVQAFRGWGRGLRSGIVNWYNDKAADRLAYQMVKYRQRAGWTHRDVLRKAHPIAVTPEHNALYEWATQGWQGGDEPLPDIVDAYEAAQATEDKAMWVRLIADHNLPREALPTEALREPEVWEALLERMPMTAMIRNLANMTRLGVLAPFSDGTEVVLDALGDEERIRKARIHPLAVLQALVTYASGGAASGRYVWRSPKTKHKWEPVTQITDALDAAFYTSFGNVEPTGKRFLFGLDVSSSMDYAYIGSTFLTAAQATAAMALVTAAVEPNHEFVAFSHELVPVSISPRSQLDDVIQQLGEISYGGTDCALPMQYATDRKIKVDAFVTLTDNETWAGRDGHPAQKLWTYREKLNIPAKLVTVGMVSNGFSIADPNDGGMLDVVGFDTATPNIISDFVS